ncbi:MAG TPA: hypothetical protein VGG23_08890, partial [Acidimicrobiales bacterium]
GFIWLIDAALQYQPYMFSKDFVTQALEPAAVGTPWIVEHPSLWAAHLMIHHIAFYNAVFASIQLVIALAIFWRPTVRVGLAASVGWALAVWWLGEGIGGITVGVSAVMGAPGAAVVYALIALLVWPGRGTDSQPADGRCVAESGLLGPLVAKGAWSVMWLGFAALGLEAVNRSPSALHGMVDGMSDGEPGWIKVMDRALAAPLAHHGTEWSVGLAVLYVLIAAAVWVPGLIKPALVAAVAVAAVIWLAEDFGGIATGSGTDVNSGPLLALLAATLWPGPHGHHERRPVSAPR